MSKSDTNFEAKDNSTFTNNFSSSGSNLNMVCLEDVSVWGTSSIDLLSGVRPCVCRWAVSSRERE